MIRINNNSVKWVNGAPNSSSVYNGYNAYADEAGFMSNFTADELKLVKQVTQKTYINELDYTLKDGGNREFDIGQGAFSSILTNIDAKTSNAWYVNSTDSFFLLGPEQAAVVYETFGADYLMAFPTAKAVERSGMKDSSFSSNNYWPYWIRLPMNTGMSYENISVVDTNRTMSACSANGYQRYAGVRPAFYLNLSADQPDFGDGLKWSVVGNLLTISGTGSMENFDYSDNVAPWSGYADNVDTIVIENGVTNIGNFAFNSVGLSTGMRNKYLSIFVGNTVRSVGEEILPPKQRIKISFSGDAPEISSDAFGIYGLDIYYDANKNGWENAIAKKYENTSIAWIYSKDVTNKLAAKDIWSFPNDVQYFGGKENGYYITRPCFKNGNA